jgi:hypothetical protein
MFGLLPGLQRLQEHLGEFLLLYELHERGFILNTDREEEAGQTRWPSLNVRQLAHCNDGLIDHHDGRLVFSSSYISGT